MDPKESIKQNGYWLEKNGFPQIWKWVQRKVSAKSHIKGIDYTLTRLRDYMEKGVVKNPWSYAEQIYKICGPHFYEKEGVQEADLVKMEFEELVNDLRALRRR